MLSAYKLKRRFIITTLLLFMLANVVAAFHAYKFTHFTERGKKTLAPEKLSLAGKLKTLMLGIENPRPVTRSIPQYPYSTILIDSDERLACWYIPADTAILPAKGTVAMFHGYSGDKSGMLQRAYEFRNLGYNTFLVDFPGSGGSGGMRTTIGYNESKVVRAVFQYLCSHDTGFVYLFGSSMGAVAILKAVDESKLKPSGIILECPFGSMYQTVCARFTNMHVPHVPMASLLTFWGGLINGFNAFNHNPVQYAAGVSCPALLIYGLHDKNVSKQETNEIFRALSGPKKLLICEKSGHDNFLQENKEKWVQGVSCFLYERK